MPLPPFRLPSSESSSSIVIDASNVGDTTVTVAVSAPRAQEVAFLESIYEHGSEMGFKPFYHKSNNFQFRERRRLCEGLIRDHRQYLSAFAHSQTNGNANTEQIEAVHSAIHVDDLLEDPTGPLVIVDGNEQQATPFIQALSGLRTELPTVTHCLQSEWYYPTALLADLASNYLAHSIERGEYDYADPLLAAPRAKHSRSNAWGRAFSAMYRNGGGEEYSPPEIPNLRGESVRERICCWFHGAVAMDAGAGRPMSDSLTQVVQALRREGYADLAATFEEL